MCTNEGEMCMIIERRDLQPNESVEPIIPRVVYSFNDPEEVRAITYTAANGIKYQLSNEDGHKVYLSGSMSTPRPMTKKEFKDICETIISNSEYYGDVEETILAEMEKLDFSIGHANSTFEIVKSCVDFSKLGTLVLNLGSARYFYHPDENTVFHVDHSKLINGHMLLEPEKEEIITKITSSKTMTKKIQRALNS